LEVLPEPAFSIEIEIEGFVIGAIPHVVTDVTLPDEVKGCREKERESDADNIVHCPVRVQNLMLCLMKHDVAGIHDECVSQTH
jgi:hypothetical protein